jgi:FkbM family methyltransferase
MALTTILRTSMAHLLPRKLKKNVKAVLLRLVWGSQLDASSNLTIASFNGFDVAFRRGTADESVLKQAFDSDIFFPGVPEYQPSDTDVIIDVGAHIGTFALLAAAKAAKGSVYAIEACQDTFNFLRINCALSKHRNLSTHQLALSDKDGTCTLYYDVGNWGHSVVSQLSEHSETVACCTLQHFFEENGIGTCSFIKFNCEGAEFPILLGSPGDLLRRIRVMLILYHCDLWRANSEQDLLAHLRANGFICETRNCTDNRGWIVATNPGWTAKA